MTGTRPASRAETVLCWLTLFAGAPVAVVLTLVSLAVLAGLLGYFLIAWWTGAPPLVPARSGWLP
jgi:hypothetical protein